MTSRLWAQTHQVQNTSSNLGLLERVREGGAWGRVKDLAGRLEF